MALEQVKDQFIVQRKRKSQNMNCPPRLKPKRHRAEALQLVSCDSKMSGDVVNVADRNRCGPQDETSVSQSKGGGSFRTPEDEVSKKVDRNRCGPLGETSVDLSKNGAGSFGTPEDEASIDRKVKKGDRYKCVLTGKTSVNLSKSSGMPFDKVSKSRKAKTDRNGQDPCGRVSVSNSKGANTPADEASGALVAKTVDRNRRGLNGLSSVSNTDVSNHADRRERASIQMELTSPGRNGRDPLGISTAGAPCEDNVGRNGQRSDEQMSVDEPEGFQLSKYAHRRAKRKSQLQQKATDKAHSAKPKSVDETDRNRAYRKAKPKWGLKLCIDGEGPNSVRELSHQLAKDLPGDCLFTVRQVKDDLCAVTKL
jgi:hypothetical protein